MVKEITRHGEKQGVLWEIPSKSLPCIGEEDKSIRGTLILDVDGTLTTPGKKYAIDDEAIKSLCEFLRAGGGLIFCTGATRGRIERSVLNPLYQRLDIIEGSERANQLFESVYIMPENGSALLLNRGVSVVENELKFDWYCLHELHVPYKKEIRKLIQEELMPKYPGSKIAGDSPSDSAQRDYILSWKELSNTLELKKKIETEVAQKHPEIDWERISLKAARTTIDFVNADSGKTISVEWVLRELSSIEGPTIGFGDLGDEFAKVVPTINVNKQKPNEFRIRGMPSMELTGGWELLNGDRYVVVGEGAKAKVRDRTSDKEIQVLQDERGNIIYAEKTEKGLSPTTPDKGHPVEIKPLVYEEGGKPIEVEDAGKGTAWMIQKLMNVGYFKP